MYGVQLLVGRSLVRASLECIRQFNLLIHVVEHRFLWRSLAESAVERVDEYVVNHETLVSDGITFGLHLLLVEVEFQNLIAPIVDGFLHVVIVLLVRHSPELVVGCGSVDDVIERIFGYLSAVIEVMMASVVEYVFRSL